MRTDDVRGWCIFEGGVSHMADAHLAQAEAQLQRQRRQPPAIVQRAQQSRPKVTDISGGQPLSLQQPAAARPSVKPLMLLRATASKIDRARFTNKGDKRAVQHLLFQLEWTMHAAVDSVLTQGRGGAKTTVSPRRQGVEQWSGLPAAFNTTSTTLVDEPSTSTASHGNVARRGSAPSPGTRRGSAPSPGTRSGVRRGSAPSAGVHRGNTPSAGVRRGSAPSNIQRTGGAGGWASSGEYGTADGGVELALHAPTAEPLSSAELLFGSQHPRRMSGGYI